MATITHEPGTGTAGSPPPTATPGDQSVALRGVGWPGYDDILRLRGDRPRPRLVYLDGDVELMSPSQRHEDLSIRVELLVIEVALGLGLPCKACRSTTFRREGRRGGAEADASFYLAHADDVRGRTDLDLEHVPPPDLVVEVVHTHAPGRAVEVWRRLGVPEVWLVRADRLDVLALGADGYAPVDSSAALGGLAAVEIHRRLALDPDAPLSEWLPPLRRWAAEADAPRRGEGGGG